MVNGQRVHPMIASGVATTEQNGIINGVNTARLSVFGFLADAMIRYWSWDLLAPWRSENATQTFGFLGSSGTIVGTPAAVTSTQYLVPEPLVRDGSNCRSEPDGPVPTRALCVRSRQPERGGLLLDGPEWLDLRHPGRELEPGRRVHHRPPGGVAEQLGTSVFAPSRQNELLHYWKP